MNTWRAIHAFIVLIAGVVGACSSLKVTTEVFRGDLERTMQGAADIHDAAARIPGQIQVAAKQAAQTYEENQPICTELFGGTAEQVEASFRNLFGEVEKEALDLANSASELVTHISTAIGGRSLWAGDPMALRVKATGLRIRLDRLGERFGERIEAVKRDSEEEWRSAVLAFHVANGEEIRAASEEIARLSRLTGIDVQSSEQLAQANERLEDLAKDRSVIPNWTPVAQLDSAQDTIETVANQAQIDFALPMSDEAVARIIGAPDTMWVDYFNEVAGRTGFGNAEIAIKMENPGVYSMKGVVFDPSQVSKAVMDGLEGAVAIAAAASGAPVRLQGGKDDDARAQATPISGYELTSAKRAIQVELSARKKREHEAFLRLHRLLQEVDGAAPTADLRDLIRAALTESAAAVESKAP